MTICLCGSRFWADGRPHHYLCVEARKTRSGRAYAAALDAMKTVHNTILSEGYRGTSIDEDDVARWSFEEDVHHEIQRFTVWSLIWLLESIDG